MNLGRPWRPSAALVAIGALLILTGCAVGPDYKRPPIDLPAAYPAAPRVDADQAAAPAVAVEWWTLFGDAMLDDLVSGALKNNVDIRQALAQIEEADGVLAEANASLFPEVDLGASVSKSRSSQLSAQRQPAGTPAVAKSHGITLSTSFELDFWGRLRRASEAAQAQALATRYAKDVTALTLAGVTAQSYFTLRSLDAQIVVTMQTLASREESLALVSSRAKGGLASDLEVNQAESARADAAIQLRELQRQRALVEHQLGTLTGRLNLGIPPGTLENLPVPPMPPLGLPSNLIEHRPDIQQAEQALVSANAQIGVARAAQLPTFSLTGSFGGQSEALRDLFKSGARIWSIGPSVSMPIFDAGKYAARTRQAEARAQQAAASYEKAAQTAFREVADALSNLQQASADAADQQARVAAARNALRLSRLRYEAGYAGYLEVLDAQRSANTAELALLQNHQSQLLYSVDLMKSLGGGWSPSAASPEAQR